MKSLFIAILILSAFVAQSQPVKGTFLVGGSVSHQATKYSYVMETIDGPAEVNGKNSSFSVSPTAGYFFTSRFCAGLSLPVTISKSSQEDVGVTSKNKSIGLGPFVRYYIPLSEKFFVIVNGGYEWNFGKNSSLQYDFLSGEVVLMEYENNSTRWHAGAGVNYFLTKNISLALLSSYQKYSKIMFYKDYSNFSTQLGFQLYFSRE